MEENTSKPEPRVCWTRLLKLKVKANTTKTRWPLILKPKEEL